MSNANASTAPGRPGDIGSPVQRRSPYATRRRILVLVSVVVLLGAAALANYGPLQGYRDARARLEKATTGLAALEQQKNELQSQLGRLTEASYLESLARDELTYARPGEELYIITDAASGSDPASSTTTTTSSSNAASAEQPGFFERLLSGFVGLFE